MSNIIAVCNLKGGVGKSTTSAALAALMAASGRRVLLVDMDPQASITAALGVDAEGASMAEVLGGRRSVPMRSIIREVRPGLDLAPADISMTLTEQELYTRQRREIVLRGVLDTVSRNYDTVIIDSPPSLGNLSVNVLAAACGIITPVLPSVPDLRGLKLFLDALAEVKPTNPGVQLLGVVVCQYDQRTTAHREVLAMIEGAGFDVLATVPRSVRVQEASGYQKLPPEHDPTGKITTSYQALMERVIAWQNNH